MNKVILVGTSHLIQCESAARESAGAETFVDYLAGLVKSFNASSLAEEMSDEGLAERGISETVAGNLARQLGIPYDLSDPDTQTREALGIFQRNDIEAAGFLANRTRAQIEAEVARTYQIRERFWAQRLQALNAFPLVFVCGAAHVDSFRDVLTSLGFEVRIASRNWPP